MAPLSPATATCHVITSGPLLASITPRSDTPAASPGTLPARCAGLITRINNMFTGPWSFSSYFSLPASHLRMRRPITAAATPTPTTARPTSNKVQLAFVFTPKQRSAQPLAFKGTHNGVEHTECPSPMYDWLVLTCVWCQSTHRCSWQLDRLASSVG